MTDFHVQVVLTAAIALFSMALIWTRPNNAESGFSLLGTVTGWWVRSPQKKSPDGDQ
jgi:hypothetical protein